MAVKDIIARGIGFAPGSIKYIVTHGLEATVAVIATPASRTIGISARPRIISVGADARTGTVK